MGITYNTSIVRDGLVLHLDAANIKSYPGSGTTWNDLSGNGNNGTLVNGVSYTTDNGGTMVFDGGNDYSEITPLTNTDFTNNFTLECVFKQRYNYNPGPLIEKYNWNQVGKGGWVIRFSSGNLLFSGIDRTISSSVSVTSTLSINRFYHVAVVCSGGPVNPTVLLYVNGDLNNTGTLTNSISSTIGKPVYIAQRGDGTGAFNGVNINLAKIYNKVLTATEIQQNFNAIRGRYGI